MGTNTNKKPLLAFTLTGPMAHFRKFYTNSSSLSYPFPPRTAIVGIIAGQLGLERDSYYEELKPDILRIGIQILTPYRKAIYTVNYLFTKQNVLYEKGRGTQVPLEFIFPQNGLLRYRIFVYPEESKIKEIEKLYQNMKANKYNWPVYLGITECMGWIEDPVLYSPDEVIIKKPTDDTVLITTPIPSERINTMVFSASENTYKVATDRMILSFKKEPYRSPEKPINVIWEENGKPIPVKISGEVFHIPEWEERIYGAFMEV